MTVAPSHPSGSVDLPVGKNKLGVGSEGSTEVRCHKKLMPDPDSLSGISAYHSKHYFHAASVAMASPARQVLASISGDGPAALRHYLLSWLVSTLAGMGLQACVCVCGEHGALCRCGPLEGQHYN